MAGASTWFKTAIEGRLDEVYAAERVAAAKAITAGIKQAARLTQNAYRRQVRKAGLGEGLEKAWQLKLYPARGASMKAAALVFSKSKRLHGAFDKNAVVKATKAKALLVPTPLAERLGLVQNYLMSRGNKPRRWFNTNLAQYDYGPLWTMDGKKGGRILMGKVDGLPKALAWIVRQTRLRKVLDLEGPPKKFMARMGLYIVNNFKRLERIKRPSTRVLLEPGVE